MIPTFRALVQEIEKLNTKPEPNTPEAAEWLECNDALDFLLYSKSGIIPAYISTPHLFLYAILIPEEKLEGDYVEDILNWNFTVDSGWGYGYSFEDGKAHKLLVPPLDHTATERLDFGDPIFFYRSFAGFQEQSNYVEINQQIAHILQIHWTAERNAWCKLDELGDLQDVASVHYSTPGIVCGIDLSALELFMFLTDTVLIRVFDVTRWFSDGAFASSPRETAQFQNQTNELYATRTLARKGNSDASWMRGFQVIRRVTNDEDLMALLRGESRKPKEYASFIAYDWRHQVIRDCSSDPAQLANYFIESDLPFELTPAFFRPDVLLKYKQDPDKYSFEHRLIRCRGTWSLNYDINEEGQVHAYLIDLAALPYTEQVYWKSFNESPKGGISKRSFMTDFKGQWYSDDDSLEALKHTLREFPKVSHRGKTMTLWDPYLGERSFGRLGYVVTESAKEWQDHVLELSKLLIEGLNKSTIRDLAAYLNCDDPQLGTLKLLRNCLRARNIDEELVQEILDPLELLYKNRSASAAHANKSAQRRNLKQEYKKLVADCAKSMKALRELVEKHLLDI